MAQIIPYSDAKEALERRKTRELIERTLEHMDDIRQAISDFKRSNLAVIRKNDVAD